MKAKLAALAGVLSGCLILALGRGEAPDWPRCILVAEFMVLLYGFCAFTPYFPHWLSSPPVLGCLSIVGGSLVIWDPRNMIVSSLMIGFGCRCIMLEHGK